MTICKLTITDWFTQQSSTKVLVVKDPKRTAALHSKTFPNAVVAAEWKHNGRVMVYVLEPLNKELDQEAVDHLEMSVSAFTKKWYGETSQDRVEPEIKEEYTEDEDVDAWQETDEETEKII